MEKCPLCKGRGMQVHIQQIGPGMVQQIQTVCIECKGQGERISPKDRCDNCSGSKVIREKKIIEVHVEKGEAAQLGAPPARCAAGGRPWGARVRRLGPGAQRRRRWSPRPALPASLPCGSPAAVCMLQLASSRSKPTPFEGFPMLWKVLDLEFD